MPNNKRLDTVKQDGRPCPPFTNGAITITYDINLTYSDNIKYIQHTYPITLKGSHMAPSQ